MKLPGIVTNITAFGVFVDIGVHQDGLVHISELSDRFVKNPAEVVKVHQPVTVTVLEVDLARKRISLSLKDARPQPDGVSKGQEKKREEKRRKKGRKKLRNPKAPLPTTPSPPPWGTRNWNTDAPSGP